MKAERVGDDQRVGRHGESARLRQSERSQLGRIDAEGALTDLDIRRMSRGKAHVPLPGQSFSRQPVRAGNIGEGPPILGNIGEEEPCLDRRMKGIGVQECLRIGRSSAGVAQDALHPDDRLGIAAAGIADQPAPVGRSQHRSERGKRGKSFAVEGDLAHDRIALGNLPQRAAIGSDLTN